MRLADKWKDYRLIDCTGGEKLEQWGECLLIRPDPQVIWKTPRRSPLWEKAQGHYHRSEKGGGQWEFKNKLPDSQKINFDLTCCGRLTYIVRPTGFKHMGLFPEQAVNWEMSADLIDKRVRSGKEVNVLNLFAYTGGATLACAAAGAKVCHVDAAKGMVEWARSNAAASGLSDKPVRWIVDDCGKFVSRERKRGRRYDAIILDPPSYGRGPGGEMWKIEDCIYDLLMLCAVVLTDDPLFVLLNSYTTGLSPSVTSFILRETVGRKFKGSVFSDEIGIPIDTGGVLPCGATAFFVGGE